MNVFLGVFVGKGDDGIPVADERVGAVAVLAAMVRTVVMVGALPQDTVTSDALVHSVAVDAALVETCRYGSRGDAVHIGVVAAKTRYAVNDTRGIIIHQIRCY